MLWILGLFVLCGLVPAQAQTTRSVTLSWDAVTTNEDGTPADDLAGYLIYYAMEPIADNKSNATLLGETDAATTTLTAQVTIPSGGRVYFRGAAFDTGGNESALSNEVSIDGTAPGTITIRFIMSSP